MNIEYLLDDGLRLLAAVVLACIPVARVCVVSVCVCVWGSRCRLPMTDSSFWLLALIRANDVDTHSVSM